MIESVRSCPPRLIVAAPRGQSGKTSVSVGLCLALRKRELRVQPFKIGPDHVDPSWLSAAADSSCRNLIPFLMDRQTLLTYFQDSCRGVDLALIEGVRGLFDKFDLDSEGSTADVARLLRAPIILVVDVTGMVYSVAALVNGYRDFEPALDISGVILNNVFGSRHERKLVSAIERYCDVPLLGSIPRGQTFKIGQRYSGRIGYSLPPYNEDLDQLLRRAGEAAETYLDVKRILAIAKNAQDIEPTMKEGNFKEQRALARIGVMSDRVFTFYYPDNLEALQRAGGELVFIDSLNDKGLPSINGLYIGGGFLEPFLEKLEDNSSLRRSIAKAVADGLSVYAEGAGLMYLCRGINWRTRHYEMVGAIPCEVEACPQPRNHGYVEAEVVTKNPLFPIGLKLRGHEFYPSRLSLYSKLSGLDGLKFAYRMQRGGGVGNRLDGILYRNIFAAYTQLHALGTPEWAPNFVSWISQN